MLRLFNSCIANCMAFDWFTNKITDNYTKETIVVTCRILIGCSACHKLGSCHSYIISRPQRTWSVCNLPVECEHNGRVPTERCQVKNEWQIVRLTWCSEYDVFVVRSINNSLPIQMWNLWDRTTNVLLYYFQIKKEQHLNTYLVPTCDHILGSSLFI